MTEEFVSINNLWNNYRWEHFQTIWEASKSLKSEVEATKVYNWWGKNMDQEKVQLVKFKTCENKRCFGLAGALHLCQTPLFSSTLFIVSSCLTLLQRSCSKRKQNHTLCIQTFHWLFIAVLGFIHVMYLPKYSF